MVLRTPIVSIITIEAASILDGDLAEVLEAGAEAGHEGGALGEGHGAEVVEGLGEDGGVLVLDDAHDVVHQQVVEGDADGLIDGLLHDLGGGDGFGGGGAVGLYETGGAELDAAEIAHDGNDDVGEPGGVELPEDGLAGGA